MGAVASGMTGQLALIASGILVARALGVEDRGYLALLLLFPQFLVTLVGAGIPPAVTYYLAGRQCSFHSMKSLLLRVLPVQLLLILLMHGSVLFLYLANKPDGVVAAGILSILVGPLALVQEYGYSLLQGRGRFGALNVVRLLLPMTYAAAVLVLYLADGATLAALVVAWMVPLLLSCLVILLLALPGLPDHDRSRAAAPKLSALVGFGLKGVLGTASPIESFRLDQIIAGLFLSPVALGLYVVGRAFANIPVLIATSAMTIAYPAIARAGQGTEGRVLMWKYFAGVASINLALVVLISIAIPWLLPLAFGDEFRAAIPLAQLLLVATAIYGCYRVLGEGMRGLGFPHLSSYAELSIWPWLTIGVPVLVWKWKETGLAAGVVMAYAVALVVTLVLVRRAAR